MTPTRVRRRSEPQPRAASRSADVPAAQVDTAGAAAATSDVEALRAEPEPGWADAIRRGRRARAERLRPVFASFDDDGAADGVPVDGTGKRPEA